MNFSEVLKTLNEASAFELFRLRAAINVVLDEPAPSYTQFKLDCNWAG